jgi:hypothetical protein
VLFIEEIRRHYSHSHPLPSNAFERKKKAQFSGLHIEPLAVHLKPCALGQSLTVSFHSLAVIIPPSSGCSMILGLGFFCLMLKMCQNLRVQLERHCFFTNDSGFE